VTVHMKKINRGDFVRLSFEGPVTYSDGQSLSIGNISFGQVTLQSATVEKIERPISVGDVLRSNHTYFDCKVLFMAPKGLCVQRIDNDYMFVIHTSALKDYTRVDD
jgi:hypothetical protein